MRCYVYPYEIALDTDVPEGEEPIRKITFPDIPGAVSEPNPVPSEDEQAQTILNSISAGYLSSGRVLPQPSPAQGRPTKAVRASLALKSAIREAMVRAGLTNEALGLRLGTSESAVRRLTHPKHESKLSKMEDALEALGCRIEITIIPADAAAESAPVQKEAAE